MVDTLSHWIIEETPREPTQAQRQAIEGCIHTFDIWHKIGKVYEVIPFAGWEHIPAGRNCAPARWKAISEHYDFIGKTVLDLGGNFGHFAFRALAAGASRAVVIDAEETEIAAGPLFAQAYGFDNIEFISARAPAALEALDERFDCAFALSMLPYLRYQNGDTAMAAASKWLRENVTEAVFIEPQLDGDSVGPPFWKDNGAVSSYFRGFGFDDCRVVGTGFLAGLGAKRDILRLSTWSNPLDLKDGRSKGITTNATVHGGDGRRVVKWDKDGRPRREFEMLRRLQGPGFPRAIEVTDNYIVMTDVGFREPITDISKVRASADAIVKELDSAGIKHGDIGEWNVVINDNMMHLIDFGTARDEGDKGYQPRSGSNGGNMAKLLKFLEGQSSG